MSFLDDIAWNEFRDGPRANLARTANPSPPISRVSVVSTGVPAKSKPLRRAIVNFRLVGDPPNAWHSAISACHSSAALESDLRERFGDRLDACVPRPEIL